MDLIDEFPSAEAEFRRRFADEEQCRAYLARLIWPEGFRCGHCGGKTAYFLPSKRVVYECAGCGHQISVIAGTIFEQSKKPLVLWFRAIFEVTASKQGISAAELQRKLGLGRYQTAWSWLHKIRSAMVRPHREPLSGEVEIDESDLGAPEAGKPGRASRGGQAGAGKLGRASRGGQAGAGKPGRASRGGQPGRAAGKTAIIAAAVEKRGSGCGRVRLGSLTDVSAKVLIGFVRQPLAGDETAHTDGWRGYARLGKTGDQHIVSVLSQLDQTAAEVLPRVHLVFPLLKRWILGTHQGSVSLHHLAGYLEEFTFRFNRRRARRSTHGAERLLGIAMATPPRPFWRIIGRPHPEGKARLAVAA